MRGRALKALDRALQGWGEKRPWEDLRRYETVITNGTRFLTLPSRVREIIDIVDESQGCDVTPGQHWGRNRTSTWTTDRSDTSPRQWRKIGVAATIQPLSEDSQLEINTTVSEVFNVLITGLGRDTTASGTAMELFHIQDALAMSGTGATVTSKTFAEVHSIEKGTFDTTADVVIKQFTNGAPLARIYSEDRRPNYQRVEWLYVPPAGKKMRVEYYIRPDRLASEGTVLPTAIDREYLVWSVVGAMHWMNNEPQAAQTAWQRAELIMQEAAIAERTQGENAMRIEPNWMYENMEGPDLVDGGGW